MQPGDLKSIMREISDIFGIIRNNYQSYISFRDDIQRQSFEKNLGELLERLTRFRRSNGIVLSHLLAWAGKNYPLGTHNIDTKISHLLDEDHRYFFDPDPDREFQEVLSVLIHLRSLLEEISAEFIRQDHNLYERVDRAIERRIRVVEFLNSSPSEPFSRERFSELAEVYQDLIEDLENCKSDLANLRNPPAG